MYSHMKKLFSSVDWEEMGIFTVIGKDDNWDGLVTMRIGDSELLGDTVSSKTTWTLDLYFGMWYKLEYLYAYFQ